jgi:Na+-transporting methylmalonyl-CoA/oxaloacetate decarboxylase gamma subunit
MADALWITLIGMGLVFVAILLLWAGMALLVWVTREKEGSQPADEVEAQETKVVFTSLTDHRRRAAAAAAVSVALALRKPTRREDGALPGGGLSVWQAVNRASQVNQAANLSRKKVTR